MAQCSQVYSHRHTSLSRCHSCCCLLYTDHMAVYSLDRSIQESRLNIPTSSTVVAVLAEPCSWDQHLMKIENISRVVHDTSLCMMLTFTSKTRDRKMLLYLFSFFSRWWLVLSVSILNVDCMVNTVFMSKSASFLSTRTDSGKHERLRNKFKTIWQYLTTVIIRIFVRFYTKNFALLLCSYYVSFILATKILLKVVCWFVMGNK